MSDSFLNLTSFYFQKTEFFGVCDFFFFHCGKSPAIIYLCYVQPPLPTWLLTLPSPLAGSVLFISSLLFRLVSSVLAQPPPLWAEPVVGLIVSAAVFLDLNTHYVLHILCSFSEDSTFFT